MNNDNQKFELLTARLSDLEKGKLFAFCQDEVMVLAVEKVLTYAIGEMGTVKEGDKKVYDVNWAFGLGQDRMGNPLPDDVVGRELKARVTGLSYLQESIQQLKKFGVKQVETKEVKNKAR